MYFQSIARGFCRKSVRSFGGCRKQPSNAPSHLRNAQRVGVRATFAHGSCLLPTRELAIVMSYANNRALVAQRAAPPHLSEPFSCLRAPSRSESQLPPRSRFAVARRGR